MTGMLMFLVPIFVKIFDQLGGELPTLTQYVLHASNGLAQPLIPGLPLPGSFLRRRRSSASSPVPPLEEDRVRPREVGRFKLRIPIQIGIVVRKVAMARWSQTLSTLIASGVDIMRALEITAQTSGNWVVEEETSSSPPPRRGRLLDRAAADRERSLPPDVAQMVKIGEETGELEKMLGKVADFYEDEVDASVQALTSIIEPMMMVGVGIMVGVIIISMYLPMFKLLTLVK